MPYKPIMRVRSHALIVEDARLAEKSQYEQDADELALVREADEARMARGELSIGDRLRRIVRRGPA
jgi:hypothetical protein